MNRKNFFAAGSTGSFGGGFFASTACARLLAPKHPIPLESFRNLTSLARASLSSFILGSSYILEVAVVAPKQIASSLQGEEVAEVD